MINTHYHGDHSGGNVKMQAQNVQVVASERARRKMVETNQPGAPNVTLDNSVKLYLGGKRVEVYHFGRAHTDGDIVAYFPDHRVVSMGDMFTVGEGLPPLVDYPGGGSTREWPRSIEGALALDFDTAIPGHGKPTTKDDLRKYRDSLTTLGRRVHRNADQERLARRGREGAAQPLRLSGFPHPVVAGWSDGRAAVRPKAKER